MASLVALIAVAIIAAVILLGNKVKGTFTCVANSLPQTSTSHRHVRSLLVPRQGGPTR